MNLAIFTLGLWYFKALKTWQIPADSMCHPCRRSRFEVWNKAGACLNPASSSSCSSSSDGKSSMGTKPVPLRTCHPVQLSPLAKANWVNHVKSISIDVGLEAPIGGVLSNHEWNDVLLASISCMVLKFDPDIGLLLPQGPNVVSDSKLMPIFWSGLWSRNLSSASVRSSCLQGIWS